MKFSLVKGDPLKIKTECLVVGIYGKGELSPTAEAIDKASDGAVSAWLKSGDIHTCLGHVSLFHNFPGVAAKRVLFVGLGHKNKESNDLARAVALAIKTAYVCKQVTLTPLEWNDEADAEWILQTATVAAGTALDRPFSTKTKDMPWKKPSAIEFICNEDEPALKQAVDNGMAIIEGLTIAKKYGDMPANKCTPKFLADEAEKIGKDFGFKVTVLNEKDIAKQKMGCILGVAQGSTQAPRVIVMEYKGVRKNKPIVLVGKGLTFDAGGISLKPGAGMDEMKYDMSGASCMIGVMAAIAKLKLPINVTAIVGCTENMPDGNAVKPGDILQSYSGKTVEVLNTDAEGRLVLCDLLSYAVDKFEPASIIDAATLTGACVVALGTDISGLFANDETLAMELLIASEASLDPAWRMPLGRRFTKMLDSRFADMANIGGGRNAGACTAAAFLQEFVGDTPWAHLDVAGTAWKTGKEKGSTGRPLPLLVNFLIDQAY